MIKRILVLVVVLLFTQVTPIFADNKNLDLPSTLINPDSLYYPAKRVWEKLREKLIFSTEGKIEYEDSLLKVRLAELKFIVDNKILSEVQRSTERFAYTAGILTDELTEQNGDEKKQNLIGKFKQYNELLEELRDKFEANSSFWMLVQHDINTLLILSERLR